MSFAQNDDVPISKQEAQLLFNKSKKVVEYAVWKDKVRARQSVNSENWMLSLNSCIALWGEPVMQNLVNDIREGWEHGGENLSNQSGDY